MPMPSDKAFYEIIVKGHLDKSWSSWLDKFSIAHEFDPDRKAISRITGYLADQAALHSLLTRIQSIGIPVVSVNPVESKEENNEKKA